MEVVDMFKQDEPLSEDYVFRVFMTLVNAVQEQQQVIKELKKKNADLEKKVSTEKINAVSSEISH
jgi:hypothetical protein